MEQVESDQPRQTIHDGSVSSSSPSSDSRENRDSAGAPSASQVREEEEEEEEQQNVGRVSEREYHQISMSYNQVNAATNDGESTVIRDDTWSCVIVLLTFWFFVSMTLILGVYGSVNARLGPNSSILLQPNPFFVQYLKVQELDELKPGIMLYGFHKSPPLDVVTTWSLAHNASVPNYSHKEWIYFLNRGSELNISYNINSSSETPVVLVIAQGSEGLSQWLENPAYPNSTLSWNMVQGKGTIQQDIFISSNYYVAVANLGSEVVEVQLNLSVRALLYNTTEAYYKCSLNYGLCSLKLSFLKGSSAVLTSPGSNQDTSDNEGYVRLSYGPQWITYIAGIGGLTVLMVLAFNYLNKFQCARGNRARVQYGEMGSQRTPLLSHKDDDLSSWGSSYDSVSNDEEDPEEWLAVGSLEGKSIKDGENNNNPRRLCVICFDAPRDCFFLPCGHCAACFTCGTRIAEADGACPICRRNMKKVRKIFTV